MTASKRPKVDDTILDQMRSSKPHVDREMGKGRAVRLTAACKKGQHGDCTSITCECDCGHGFK